ncbi:helix-turn-helix domain-containing protein [Enterococcus sp. 669A]|uniref:Helix-turn-helix domain-containing protein n=1 Tax=Candidatus Enterococcus moelleringii TaxID=2815325 RepID=A0ABS3L8E5_9ENTE|nr:helix-turn-helix domain-containing protein [Enterococcus sp. 669A]MBO1305370.1 helix-turn-helix domain-containing protein [Enterococcus sp. 669A]
MRQLLSAKHNIQLSIMEAFLAKNEIAIEELEALTGASKQTIRTYIDEIEQSTDFFVIQRGMGTYFLKRNNRTTYSTIYRYFYQESIHLRLIEYIFLNPFSQTKDIVEHFGISRSQFNQLRHNLKHICKLYDFSLSDSPFKLQGDYHTICAFYIPYMLEKYDRTDEFISTEENKVLDQLLLSFTNLPHRGGIQDHQRLKVWLWVTIKLSKHFPEYLNHGFSEADNDHFVLSHQQFEEAFSVKFPGFINSALSELYYYMEQDVASPELINKKKAALTFAQNLFDLLGGRVPFTNSRVLDTTLSLYKNRNYILNNQKQRFVQNFFEQNSCFPETVAQALQQEFLRYRAALDNDSLFFELLYSLIVNETTLTQLVMDNQLKKKVGVLYAYDKDHSELFSYQLNNSFTNNLAFEVIDYDLFCDAKASLEGFDFIITSLTTIKRDNCVVTDIFPTVADIRYLNELVNHSIQQDFEQGLKQALVGPLPDN